MIGRKQLPETDLEDSPLAVSGDKRKRDGSASREPSPDRLSLQGYAALPAPEALELHDTAPGSASRPSTGAEFERIEGAEDYEDVLDQEALEDAIANNVDQDEVDELQEVMDRIKAMEQNKRPPDDSGGNDQSAAADATDAQDPQRSTDKGFGLGIGPQSQYSTALELEGNITQGRMISPVQDPETSKFSIFFGPRRARKSSEPRTKRHADARQSLQGPREVWPRRGVARPR